MADALTFFAVFCAMTLTDFVWARYTKAIADGRIWPASSLSVAIIMCGAYVTTSYVENHWNLIPAGLGAFAGTWISMKWDTVDG